MVNNIPVNGWPQLKDLEAVQPILNRLDKIEAWKRTVKEEIFTGDDITIENALALPARSLITEINAIQDLHGYDKPWAGGAGKNKWPFGDFNGTYSNVPFSLAAGTYTASKTNSDVNCGLRFFYADDTSIAFTFFTSETFTLTADVVKINYSSADATTENFMIESGSTATSYAPYSNICPISGRTEARVDTENEDSSESAYAVIQLGQTVYGAEINWDTGVMTVNKGFETLEGASDENWQTSGLSSNTYYIGLPNSVGYDESLLCNMGKRSASIADVGDCLVNQYNNFIIKTTYDTVSAFKAALANNPLQICYTLATPTTLQLTPTQLQMLKGYNHITLSDGYGTIELKALTSANWS